MLRIGCAASSVFLPRARLWADARLVGARSITCCATGSIYRGEVVHRGIAYLGEHEAIVDEGLWNAVQAKLSANIQVRRRTRIAIETVSERTIITAPATYPAADGVFVAFQGQGTHCPTSTPGRGVVALKIRAGSPPAMTPSPRSGINRTQSCQDSSAHDVRHSSQCRMTVLPGVPFIVVSRPHIMKAIPGLLGGRSSHQVRERGVRNAVDRVTWAGQPTLRLSADSFPRLLTTSY